MISREQIGNFLRVNHVSESADDQEIINALTSARWDKEDAEAAVRVLRNKSPQTEAGKKKPGQNLFYSDTVLSPDSLSSLLGIDIKQLRIKSGVHRTDEASEGPSALMIILSIILGISLAAGSAFLYMYHFNVGPFYTPVDRFQL